MRRSILAVARLNAPSGLSQATLRALLMCAAVALSACHQPAQSSSSAETVTDVSQGGPRRVEEIHRGVQTVCRVDGKEFPPSFLVSDLGKPGVPKLNADELHDVHLISRYVHSPTLRFQEVAGQFLIYDASFGPCFLAAPGYWVLNAASCNLYFMPADEWSGPSAVPSCGNPPSVLRNGRDTQ